MNYYISRGGKQYGPYTVSQLEQMARERRVVSSDLVWVEDYKNWVPASEVIGYLFSSTPPPVQPSAPANAGNSQPAGTGPASTPPTPSVLSFGGYAAPSAPVPGAPIPPDFHWALVLLLAFVTCGIFPIVWIFIQAGFVKKIDRQSNAIVMLIIFLVVDIVGYVMMIAGGSGGSDMEPLLILGNLIILGDVVIWLVAVFGMKNSLEGYYNSVEKINLRLSGVMTFFFSIYYFQHHFTRIAKWKTTGYLAPQ